MKNTFLCLVLRNVQEAVQGGIGDNFMCREGLFMKKVLQTIDKAD